MAEMFKGVLKGLAGIGLLFVGFFMAFASLMYIFLGIGIYTIGPSLPMIMQQLLSPILYIFSFAGIIYLGLGTLMTMYGFKWTFSNENSVVKLVLFVSSIIVLVIGAIIMTGGTAAFALGGLFVIGTAVAIIHRASGINVLPYVNKTINTVVRTTKALPG